MASNDRPWKREQRALDAFLKARETTGFVAPKANAIEPRRAANRRKRQAVERVLAWQERHRKTYNARMRKYRRRMKVNTGGRRCGGEGFRVGR